MQGARVQSLLRELRSYMFRGQKIKISPLRQVTEGSLPGDPTPPAKSCSRRTAAGGSVGREGSYLFTTCLRTRDHCSCWADSSPDFFWEWLLTPFPIFPTLTNYWGRKWLGGQCRVEGLSSFPNFNFNFDSFSHINFLLHQPKAIFVVPVSRHSEEGLLGLEGHETFRPRTRQSLTAVQFIKEKNSGWTINS